MDCLSYVEYEAIYLGHRTSPFLIEVIDTFDTHGSSSSSFCSVSTPLPVRIIRSGVGHCQMHL